MYSREGLASGFRNTYVIDGNSEWELGRVGGDDDEVEERNLVLLNVRVKGGSVSDRSVMVCNAEQRSFIACW